MEEYFLHEGEKIAYLPVVSLMQAVRWIAFKSYPVNEQYSFIYPKDDFGIFSDRLSLWENGAKSLFLKLRAGKIPLRAAEALATFYKNGMSNNEIDIWNIKANKSLKNYKEKTMHKSSIPYQGMPANVYSKTEKLDVDMSQFSYQNMHWKCDFLECPDKQLGYAQCEIDFAILQNEFPLTPAASSHTKNPNQSENPNKRGCKKQILEEFKKRASEGILAENWDTEIRYFKKYADTHHNEKYEIETLKNIIRKSHYEKERLRKIAH